MKLVQKRSRKTGLPPGTLVHIGEKTGQGNDHGFQLCRHSL